MPPEAPEPPWRRATAKRRSMRSERRGAALDGGRVTPMSGAGRKKGDYHANGYVVEDKITDAESFTVTSKMLDKTCKEAAATPPGMLPQWRITLPRYRLRILREEDYLYLEALAGQNRDDAE